MGLAARRYPEIADEVREICERYDLPYNTGRLGRQLVSVAGTISRRALPSRTPSSQETTSGGPDARRCLRMGRMPDHLSRDQLSRAEIRKDAVQSTVEAAAGTVGAVTTILTSAVKEVAGVLGGFATEIFEIRDSARRAAADADDD